MIRPPSNQHPYDTHLSGDPAFVQPPEQPAPPASDASEADRAKYDEAVKTWCKAHEEHQRKIKQARETGDWSPLLIEGMQPTKFVLKPLDGDQYRWLADRALAGELGMAEFHALAFRCALVDVSNFGDVRIGKPVNHEKLGQIASKLIPNKLDAIDTSFVNELGAAIVERATTLAPKS